MTKAETLKFMKKIKSYYQSFSMEDYVIEEWVERLREYDLKDLERKFEEHLKGEYALEPPKLHFLIKYLKTIEEKEKSTNDYLVRCNLCGEEMYYSEYNNTHHKKCLLIKTLVKVLRKRGEDVDYETLNEYDYETLDKIYDKYVPLKKNIQDILKKIN